MTPRIPFRIRYRACYSGGRLIRVRRYFRFPRICRRATTDGYRRCAGSSSGETFEVCSRILSILRLRRLSTLIIITAFVKLLTGCWVTGSKRFSSDFVGLVNRKDWKYCSQLLYFIGMLIIPGSGSDSQLGSNFQERKRFIFIIVSKYRWKD